MAEALCQRGHSHGFVLQCYIAYGTPCTGARPQQECPAMCLPALLAHCECEGGFRGREELRVMGVPGSVGG
eukprot:14623081-Alexandrium_andersonii.AAC.1